MNHSQLKSFAAQSRHALMDMVRTQLSVVLATDSFARRSNPGAVHALEGLIQEIGQEATIEKVAYTWFNRFCALRYMDVKGYTSIGVVSPVHGQIQPEILTEAKQGFIDQQVFSPTQISAIKQILLGNDLDRESKAYKMLFMGYCNWYHRKLPFLFEHISDYTELLLPENLLTPQSVLNQTLQVLTKETCQDIEIIGWLYQYYIAPKKKQVDEAVNKQKKKVQKEDMPAKTQLFTPKWIVRYMVENSLGKLWLDSHPNPLLRQTMTYYLEPTKQEDTVQAQLDQLKNPQLRPEQIKVLDPACGSGHILVAAFDLLFRIYKTQGWQEQDIPEQILKNNLYGLDICERAAQLAQFALMMKAREFDPFIFNKVTELHICPIYDTNWITPYIAEEMGESVKDVQLANKQIELLSDTFRDAKEYGSIIKVKNLDFDFWQERIAYFKTKKNLTLNTPVIRGRLKYIIKQALIMQQLYEVVITNPPYLGSNDFDPKLSAYTKKNYPMSKSDLFAIFQEVLWNMAAPNGYNATVNQQAWMFLSSYEKLREFFVKNGIIDTLVHLGAHAFESISGEKVQSVMYVMRKTDLPNFIGHFIRLVEYPNARLKEEQFLHREPKESFYRKLSDLSNIPGFPIAYWMSKALQQIFNQAIPFSSIAEVKSGILTGNDDLFMRKWYEVSFIEIFHGLSYQVMLESNCTWIRVTGGGEARKWYGASSNIVNYHDNAHAIRSLQGNNFRLRDPKYYFKEGINWKLIRSANGEFCLSPKDVVFGNSVRTAFVDNLFYFLGLLNTKISLNIIQSLNPTTNLNNENIEKFPVIISNNSQLLSQIHTLTSRNVSISKDDWDSFETSWDFQKHPFLRFKRNGRLNDTFNAWKAYKQQQFAQLKANEEDLNRLFIEIYGLQDELTPEVEDKDITIALADEKRDIKSFLSYAVGCMLGRYSLDQEGLAYAGGEFNIKGYKTFIPDEDNVLPILENHFFEDDIVTRLKNFLGVTFGMDTIAENMRYIAAVLGGRDGQASEDVIRNYFCKQFYKDHCQIYQKRPIYWMFSSPKSGFKALIYLHRYNKDTVSTILNSYLRIYREKLIAAIEQCKYTQRNETSSTRTKLQASKEESRFQEIINEITAYERDVLYPLAARRLELDLNKGVLVNYPLFGNALQDFGLKKKENR